MSNPATPASESVLAHFGRELRHYRMCAGLTQEQLGEKVGYTGSMISSVEIGRRMPSRELADGADEVLGTDGALGRLWPLVDEHTKVTRQFREYLDREPSATAMHTYSAGLVPGLLQTPEYARVIIAAERPSLSPDVIDARLAVRLTRQELISRDDDPLRLWAIVDEATLRRTVGSKAIMAAQLRQLLASIALPNVVVQVLPDGAGATPAMGMPFILAEFRDGPDALHMDALTGVTPDSDADTLGRFRIIFDHLRASALPEAMSTEMIESRAEELT